MIPLKCRPYRTVAPTRAPAALSRLLSKVDYTPTNKIASIIDAHVPIHKHAPKMPTRAI